MKKTIFPIAVVLSVIMLFASACGDSNAPGKKTPEEEKRTMTNKAVYNRVALADSLWMEPESFFEPEADREQQGIKALYLRSDYMDEESYAFAYLGVPDGASAGDKLPAVLLIHGGGGTAYWEWVKIWKDRGYVALAVDMEGHVPTEDGTMSDAPSKLYTQSRYTTPRNQNYSDSAKPIEETWMYYAVTTAIRANSFLHSLDYVDIYKIGVTGVSWGGVITSIISGYDDRFAFSIPVYCSLNSEGTMSNMGGYIQSNPAAVAWDDPTGLYRVNTPVHIVASNIDRSSMLDSITQTYLGLKNGSLTVIKDMLHAQAIAVAATESYVFADSIVKGGDKLIKILSEPDAGGAPVTISDPDKVDEVYIVYSQDDISKSSWGRRRVSLEGNKVVYEIPEGTKAFYIAVESNSGLNTSTGTVFIP